MLSLLSFAAAASATSIGKPWYDHFQPDGTPHSDCSAIAGVFAFVETVNEYDNSEVGTLPETTECAGGVGFLVISEDCTWQYKKIKNDPDNFCEADHGYGGESIVEKELEFWQIPANYGAGNPDNVPVVGNEIVDFVFTIEKVPGVKKSARRIQGVLERRNGCDIKFEGWAVQRDYITECLVGYNHGQYRDANLFKKRHARLTSSSSSSASVSDIKDALALIANAIPDFGSDSSNSDDDSSSDSSDKYAPCGEIAGVYQIVETVNEYDNSEFQNGPAGDTTGAALCNGGVAYLDIHEGCSWAYKKVSVGVHKSSSTVPVYDCVDDSGIGKEGVQEYEGQFCKIDRVANDNFNGDFRFAIELLEGDSYHTALRIHGVIERNRNLAVGGGCDVSFEGFRVARADLTPCKDRCYSAGNGNFEQGYDQFKSDTSRIIGSQYGIPMGGPGLAQHSVTTNPRVVNKERFDDVPCDGFCLVTSVDGALAFDGSLWEQFYQHAGDRQCCESQSYIFSFDARNVGENADADTITVAIGDAFGYSASLPMFKDHGFPSSTTLTPASDEWTHYESEPILLTTGSSFAIRAGSTSVASDTVLNGFAFDNIHLVCASIVGKTYPTGA